MSPDVTDLTTTLYIVRHGKSLDNAGASPTSARRRVPNSPSADGSKHTPSPASWPASTPTPSSPRACSGPNKTAEIIAADRHLEVRVIPDLHERSVG